MADKQDIVDLTYEQCLAALGASEGIGFRLRGEKEIPQKHFENGFIEYTHSPKYSHVKAVTNRETVIFDKGQCKGREFEFNRP